MTYGRRFQVVTSSGTEWLSTKQWLKETNSPHLKEIMIVLPNMLQLLMPFKKLYLLIGKIPSWLRVITDRRILLSSMLLQHSTVGYIQSQEKKLQEQFKLWTYCFVLNIKLTKVIMITKSQESYMVDMRMMAMQVETHGNCLLLHWQTFSIRELALWLLERMRFWMNLKSSTGEVFWIYQKIVPLWISLKQLYQLEIQLWQDFITTLKVTMEELMNKLTEALENKNQPNT